MSPLKNNRLGFSVVMVRRMRVAALEFCSQILSCGSGVPVLFGSSVVGSGAAGSCRLSPTVAKLNTTGSAALAAALKLSAPRLAKDTAMEAATLRARVREVDILIMLPNV